MKLLYTFIIIGCGLITTINAQTSLSGKVTDNTGEPLIFASVIAYQQGVLYDGRETDFDGNYNFSDIDPGIYDIEVSYVGFSSQRINGVKVLAGKANHLNVEMDSGVQLNEIVVVDYKIPLLQKDNTTQGATITSSHVRRLPRRSINALGANSVGLASDNTRGNVAVRGSRDHDTDYYIDGIQLSGNIFPEQIFKAPRQVKTKKPGGEGYAPIVENKFMLTKRETFSTFSIDVDKASYSNMRRFINQNQLPPADAIRTEELINYFHYNYPSPQGEHPFSVHTELGPCPWQEDHRLLHIGIKGAESDATSAPPANLVFLIDVSGSMDSPNKLPLVKEALAILVDQLRPQDRVAIVTYAGNFQVALEPCPGDRKDKIKNTLVSLGAGGGTAGGTALESAYQLAAQHFNPDGSNRVILATDGDFNIGISSPQELEKFISAKRKTGIYLSVLGFGMGNYKDDRLETLANKGNGNYAYIDNIEEAERLFITEMTGTLYTIAKDVKLQIEFDEQTVASYRLIGYENRRLNKRDFEDDTKDAGELGAGHTVTALYQIELKEKDTKGNLATVHLRYKHPKEDQSNYLKHHTTYTHAYVLSDMSENFRFSAAVAAFSLCLRDSKYKAQSSFDLALKLANSARQDDLEGLRAEFVSLVEKTATLSKPVTVK
jgi:Ca-activated chloride channel family protein